MVRNSLAYVNWKERKKVASDLRQIYQAATAEEAEQRLEEFEQRWDEKYAVIGKTWRRHWTGITPLFAYPAQIRRSIYTTNIVESLHMTLRKVIKTRGSFPSEESALKLLYLALKNVRKRWQPTRDWKPSLNRCLIGRSRTSRITMAAVCGRHWRYGEWGLSCRDCDLRIRRIVLHLQGSGFASAVGS